MFGQFYTIKIKKKIKLVIWIIKSKSSYLKYIVAANNVIGFLFSFYSTNVDLTFI